MCTVTEAFKLETFIGTDLEILTSSALIARCVEAGFNNTYARQLCTTRGYAKWDLAVEKLSDRVMADSSRIKNSRGHRNSQSNCSEYFPKNVLVCTDWRTNSLRTASF